MNRVGTDLHVMPVSNCHCHSQLANIDATTIRYAPDSSSVTLAVLQGFLYKNQRGNRNPPPIPIPALQGNNYPILCPVAAVKFLQEQLSPHLRNLFINPETGTVLNASTLGLWLCRAINLLVPGSIPRAHDTRKVSQTMAWIRGLPLPDIVKQWFYASPNPFIRKYLCSNQRDNRINFAAAGSSRH